MTAYPDGPLDLRAELLLGSAWTDITKWAMPDGSQWADITGGTADGAQQPSPASLSLTLDNADGRFSPRNAAGPYYGQLKRNTRARVSVAGTQPRLRLESDNKDRAYVNENTRLDITGSVEMRMTLRLTDWSPCVLAAKWDGNPASWYWALNGYGMTFQWYESSVLYHWVNSDMLPYSSGTMALRVTLNASTGTVTFYTGTGIDGTWTQLGPALSATGGAATAVEASVAPLVIGYSFGSSIGGFPVTGGGQLHGQAEEYRLYNGIGGTVAADAVFTGLAPGTTSWTDAQGNAWNLAGGAEISSRDYRLHGELAAVVPAVDGSAATATAAVTVAGPLRRIQAGSAPPVLSPVRRGMLLLTGDQYPVAYWPMEDPAGAGSLASAVPGVPDMDISGSPDLAADTSFAASAPLPVLNGAKLAAHVPPYADLGGSGGLLVRWLMKLSSGDIPSSGWTELMRMFFSGSSVPDLSVRVYAGGAVGLTGLLPDGTAVFDSGPIGWTEPPADTLKLFSIEIKPVSGGQQYTMALLTPGEPTGYVIRPTVSGGVRGRLWRIQIGQASYTGTVIGHLSVQATALDSGGNLPSLWILQGALTGYPGETAGARFARVCTENGYPARLAGLPALTQPMGVQPVDTFTAILQDVVQADQGLMFEPRDSFAIGYRTLASMYNQSPAASFSFAAANLPGKLQAADDDTDLVNDWTVSLPSGASARVTEDDPALQASTASAGPYQGTATANVLTADQLPDAAGTMLALTSADGARFRQVQADAGIPGAPPLGQVRPGDLITITGVPAVVQTGDIRAIVTGEEQLLGPGRKVTWDCQPASPYDVAVYDTARADTDGSQLAAGVSATAVTLSVSATGTSGVLWTTDPADWPFDIAVGGERMTVTHVTGTSSPQSMTVTRSVNGVSKSQLAGADVRLADTPRYAWI